MMISPHKGTSFGPGILRQVCAILLPPASLIQLLEQLWSDLDDLHSLAAVELCSVGGNRASEFWLLTIEAIAVIGEEKKIL